MNEEMKKIEILMSMMAMFSLKQLKRLFEIGSELKMLKEQEDGRQDLNKTA